MSRLADMNRKSGNFEPKKNLEEIKKSVDNEKKNKKQEKKTKKERNIKVGNDTKNRLEVFKQLLGIKFDYEGIDMAIELAVSNMSKEKRDLFNALLELK